MNESDFIETTWRVGSDWSTMFEILLQIIAGLIVACLSWLFGWTGRERKQERDNINIRVGIYVYILHFSSAARAAYPDAAQQARQLVDAVESQLGSLLAVCAGVSGRTKAIRAALDLTKPLAAGKPAGARPSQPKVTLEKAQVLVSGDESGPSEVREAFLVKAAECPAPPKESEMVRERRAQLMETLEEFHLYWSDRSARLAELRSVQDKLTDSTPPSIPSDSFGNGRSGSHLAH